MIDTVVLAGGVGAARFLRGLARELPPQDLTVIVNTADDDCFFGLEVSPDLDTITYNLAGVAPPSKGWGLSGDTDRVRGALGRFFDETWFGLGDADLATHLFRTKRLREGAPLHEVTAEIAKRFGLESTLLPMSNDHVRTEVETASGERLAFQRWFVERGARDRVRALRYRGLRRARPAPGVLRALTEARRVILAPSNPFTSLQPILGLPGVRPALRRRRAPTLAISPLRGDRSFRGPLAGMLEALGHEVSVVGIGRIYRALVDTLWIDASDAAAAPAVAALGLEAPCADLDLGTLSRSRRLARQILRGTNFAEVGAA